MADREQCNSGKKERWPELLGVNGGVAQAIIKRENPDVNVFIIKQGTPLVPGTDCYRVRIIVDNANIVIKVPVVG